MHIELLEARIAPALIFGIRDDQHLISFDSANPGNLLSDVPLTGRLHNDVVDGLAFRPSNGLLYAYTRSGGNGYIYTVNTSTGALTEVGSTPFTTAISGGAGEGFSVDPVADVLRVVDLDGHNFRVNPNTGALIAQDTTLQEPAVAPASPFVIGLAYDRNYAGAPATTLYGIDYQSKSLVRIGDPGGAPVSPNGGLVTNLGALGNYTSGGGLGTFAGMAIESRTGTAFASLNTSQSTNLYTIDLQSSVTNNLRSIGDGSKALVALAVALPSDLKIVSDQLATYTDLDGDLVTVKTTGHGLAASDFHFATGVHGSQLTELDLSGAGLAGKDLTIAATPGLHGGDGFVNVGTINAPGLALGKVTVGGNLSAINAGDGTNSVATLTVHSFGKFGVSPQDPARNGEVSALNGHLGALIVKSDLAGAQVQVTGGAHGSIGSISIGGDLLGANDGVTAAGVSTTGAIGNVSIGGSLVGGNVGSDGSIFSGGSLGDLTIGGSILGGSASTAGWVQAADNAGAMKIGSDIIGGRNSDGSSGGVLVMGNIASVTLGGSLIGGPGFNSGIVFAQSGATDDIGPVKIGGSVLGGAGDDSGTIYAQGSMGAASRWSAAPVRPAAASTRMAWERWRLRVT